MSSNFISTSFKTAESIIPTNILVFQYSYGYDCKKLFNLCLINPNELCYASGNLLHFLTISTGKITTRRSACGGGIGHITINPNPKYGYFTVAENGETPPIIIYEYPSMNVKSICTNGTQKSYSFINYSSDGEQLISQGGSPDYMLTLWDWKCSQIILRLRSFQNTVYRAEFSMNNFEKLNTCGVGHIKFWNICQTFTGLKLQGLHGRFGKTEICDIYAVCAMENGTVLSSCEWGNILVWEGGLIKTEVRRRNHKCCHDGTITNIKINTTSSGDGNEVITSGMDGCIRIWFWETVELAKPSSDNVDDLSFVEIEPIYEYFIGNQEIQHTSQILSILKKEPDPSTYWWLIQDGNGGIWQTDVCPNLKPKPNEMLFRCHAGRIVDLATCPFASFFVTFGEDGRLHLYDYQENKLIYFKQFNAKGQCIIWLPLSIEPSGLVLVLAFSDGVIRVICIDLEQPTNELITERIYLLQIWRPHNKSITKISINPDETIFVTASEDQTIFIHRIDVVDYDDDEKFVKFQPIGFVTLLSYATALNWKPEMSTIIIGCIDGKVIECNLPQLSSLEKLNTTKTYKLNDLIHQKQYQFKSVKSQIRRDKLLEEREQNKLNKRMEKEKKLLKYRKENPNVKIDEEMFLADSDSDEELEPLYIPEIPNRVLWLKYTGENTIWLSMAGYDCGFVYEITELNNDTIPMKTTIIPNAEDLEINFYLQVDTYLIFGMQDGAIRINTIFDDFHNLSDYWLLNMHDNNNGVINAIDLSYDRKFLFTCGDDGNIFKFKSNIVDLNYEQKSANNKKLPINYISDDDDIVNKLSLEEEKQQQNRDIRHKIAEQEKQKVLNILDKYKQRFNDIVVDNNELLVSQQVFNQNQEYILNSKISESVHALLDAEMTHVQGKLAYTLEESKLLSKKVKQYLLSPIDDPYVEVFGIKHNESVKTFRTKKLTKDFRFSKQCAEKMLIIEALRRQVAQPILNKEKPQDTGDNVQKVESFLAVLSPSHKLDIQMTRLLKRYRERKAMDLKYHNQWASINSVAPDIDKNHPSDVLAIQAAEESIGDHKLRSDLTYIKSDIKNRTTTSMKLIETLNVRQEQYDRQKKYCDEVFDLRDAKHKLQIFLKKQKYIFNGIHAELNGEQQKQCINISLENDQLNKLEYPEKIFNIPIRKSLNNAKIKQPNEFDFITDRADIDFNLIEKLKETPTSCTDMELEFLKLREMEKIFQQNQLCTFIEKKIQKFDESLIKLKEKRYQTEVDVKLLDLHLILLNQELWIQKDFNRLEDKIIEEINNRSMDCNQIKYELLTLENTIESHKKNIGNLKEKIINIQNEFQTECKRDKFFNFLRKVFKKKEKKINADDSSASEESESSEDEDDDEDDDDGGGGDDDDDDKSLDFGNIFIDEKIIPPGCDKELYDLTMNLRSKRYTLENQINNENAEVTDCQNKIKSMLSTVRLTEEKLNVKHEELVEFLREKQKMLNQIDGVVVLHMDQMQYFQNHEEFNKIENAFLFDNGQLTVLYERVAQLQNETLEAKLKHKINVIHLARMKTDCKCMEKTINDLQELLNETMMKKFGIIVELNELEEEVLKKMIYKLRTNVNLMQIEYNERIKELKKNCVEKKAKLKRLLEEEIEKFNILTVLKEGHNFLENIKSNFPKRTDQQNDYNEIIRQDLSKLKEISNQQIRQIGSLEKEISTLRLKIKPFGFNSLMGPDYDKNQQNLYEESEGQGTTIDIGAGCGGGGGNQQNTLYNMVNRLVCELMANYVTTNDQYEQLTYKLCDYIEQITDNLIYHNGEQLTISSDDVQSIIQIIQSLILNEKNIEIPIIEIDKFFHKIINELQRQQEKYSETPNPINLLEMILQNTKEKYESQLKSKNYVQMIVTEVFKEMLSQISMDDLMTSEFQDKLKQLLRKIIINSKSLNLEELIQNLLEFSTMNLIDSTTVELLRAILVEIM